MHKSATKCNEILGKWCKNKHGASKIIDTFETYQASKIIDTLKTYHCVVCRFHVATGRRRVNKCRKRRPCWSVIKPVRITFSRIVCSSPDRLNLGFLTEGKSVAIFITPSSWGSQRAGHSPRIKQRRGR
jgi:hypothetical protein